MSNVIITVPPKATSVVAKTITAPGDGMTGASKPTTGRIFPMASR